MEFQDLTTALYYIGAYTSVLNINGLGGENGNSKTGTFFIEGGICISSEYTFIPRYEKEFLPMDFLKVDLIKNGKLLASLTYAKNTDPNNIGWLLMDNISDDMKRDYISVNEPNASEVEEYEKKLRSIDIDDYITIVCDASDLIRDVNKCEVINKQLKKGIN